MQGGLKERLQKIDGLVAQIRGAADPETKKAALELVQTVMEFHAAGIDRMMEITSEAGEAGWNIIDAFAADDVIANLLLLHGLHPVDLETRVRGALEQVRPYLTSHGGNVDLVEIENGVVTLRLFGSCDGCPSSSVTMKTAIEKAIHEAAPDVIAIHNAA